MAREHRQNAIQCLIIAVQRYRKIVKTRGWQMDTKLNRMALFCASLVPFVFAFTTAFIYGVEPITNNKGSLTGMTCTINIEENTVLSMVYSSLVGIITFLYLKTGPLR